MKIGFDAKRAFNNKTGLGNYSRFILSAFLKIQNQTPFLAFISKEKKDIFPSFPQSHIFKTESKSAFWRIWSIKRDLIKEKVTIFHGLSNEIPFSLKNSEIKTLVTIHDLIFINHPELYPFFDRIIYTFKLRFALKYADKIIAISKQTKNDILEFCPYLPKDKIEIIYQNCDERFFQVEDEVSMQNTRKQFNLNKPYIVSVGTLEPRKNQLQLIKAFELLNNQDIDLVLVGRGKTYKKQLESYINHKNLSNVRILSDVENHQLKAVYSGSLFSAYISSIEGFGIPIIESLACGVPVLAAKGTCLEEAGGLGGMYINPENCEEIAEAMKTLIAQPKLRSELSMLGKTHIEKFNTLKLTEQLYQLYANLSLQ